MIIQRIQSRSLSERKKLQSHQVIKYKRRVQHFASHFESGLIVSLMMFLSSWKISQTANLFQTNKWLDRITTYLFSIIIQKIALWYLAAVRLYLGRSDSIVVRIIFVLKEVALKAFFNDVNTRRTFLNEQVFSLKNYTKIVFEYTFL